jgi:hypothetical protein
VTKTAEQLVELLWECHEEILCWQGANLVSCQPDEIADAISQLTRERDELREANRRLLIGLRSAEWAVGGTTQAYCPVCESLREDGHRKNCKLAALLAAPTEGGEKTAAELPKE